MKKLLLIVVVICFLLISSFVISAADKPIIMKIAHSATEEAPRHLAFVKFKEMVEEKTQGGIQVKIYPNAQLGTEKEVTEGVKLGTIQATATGSFEDIAPKLLIYTMPFLFNDIESVHKITRGPLGKEIAEESEKNGYFTIATGDSGLFRQFTNNKHPILSVSDMKGLKMRTPPIESIIKTMEALGANPVSIPFADLYMALKTGVADGQENPLINIYTTKVYEVQKYLTIINYQYHPLPFVVNLKWYKSLKSEYQKILKECAEESMIYNDDLVKDLGEKFYTKLENNMEINVVTDEQKELFKKAVAPVYNYYIAKGLFTREELEKIQGVL